ncbi:MAG: SpoIIE family protein phosphatase [Candidatus Eisenbacteria sp.]|nr:SpoIIE family protein phosphatase [Candidatus Eisenbacteria bacterium]
MGTQSVFSPGFLRPIGPRTLLLTALLAAVITLLSIQIADTTIARNLERDIADWCLHWDVVVVRLDADTLSRLPEYGWPIPRREYATFIDGIMQHGAKAVVLDLLFAFPDQARPGDDEELAAAFQRYPRRVVIGASYDIHSEENPELVLPSDDTSVVPFWGRPGYLPLDPFASAARVGHVTTVPDEDGVIRSMPLLIDCEHGLCPALCIAGVMAYLDIPEDEVSVVEREVRLGSGASNLRIPIDARSRLNPSSLHLNIRDAEHSYSFTFEELMGAILGGDGRVNGESLESIVGGKIVVVGMGDIVDDTHSTLWAASLDGVYIHAAFIMSLFYDRLTGAVDWTQLIPLVFALAAILSFSGMMLPISRGLVVAAVAIFGYLAVAILVPSYTRIPIPIVAPALGMVMPAVSIAALHLVSGERWRSAEVRELLEARTIQRMLLPKGPPEIKGIDLYGSLDPCLEVAGDSYDYFPVGSEQIAVSIGDVAGKGLHAAILMSNIQGRLRAEVPHLWSPARVIDAVNRACSLVLDPTRYATMAFAVIDVREMRLTSCLAGHCPPLIIRNDGSTQWLRVGGPPVGMLGDVPYEEERFDLEPGDTVVFYTDGITEAVAPSGEFYEETRLERVLREHAGLDAEAMARSVLADLESFTHHSPPSDDRTLLVVKMT